jgi:flagellar basal-body rod modification protein FlgD
MALPAVANANSTTTGAAAGVTSATEQSDRFLKLLVTQMQNQDPLNPLDNAQVTSQMAQISTVTGIETLNATVDGLNGQFLQLQAMQAAALVGHDVAIEGNSLRIQGDVADAGFELSTKAEKVKIEIRSESDELIDTIELEGLDAGRHDFQWDVPEAYRENALKFKVTATSGDNDVEVMALAHQRIAAVSNFGDTLALELANGDRIAHNAIWAFL